MHAYLLKNYVIAQFVEAYSQHCLQHMQLGVNCVYSLEKQYQLIYTEEVWALTAKIQHQSHFVVDHIHVCIMA